MPRAATKPVLKNPLRTATMSPRPLPGVQREELVIHQLDAPVSTVAHTTGKDSSTGWGAVGRKR